MIYVKPTKAKEVYVISKEQIHNSDDYDYKEKRFLVGIFLDSVQVSDIHEEITSHKLWNKFLSAHSIAAGEGKLMISPIIVTSGVVFETAEEFSYYAKVGITYEDILEGYEHVEI